MDRYVQSYVSLGKSNGLKKEATAWVSEVMASGTAEYSQAIRNDRNGGFCALWVELNGASDDIDITYQVSQDGETWEDTIVTTAGVAKNVVYTALGQGSAWIVFDPPISKWIRFKFDPDANSTVNFAKYIFLEL